MSSDLSLIPPELARHSISESEIVLPYDVAEQAVVHLKASGHRLIGWEGWLRYPDGRRGHSERYQGSTDLFDADVTGAQIRDAHQDWLNWSTRPDAELFFCITVVAAV